MYYFVYYCCVLCVLYCIVLCVLCVLYCVVVLCCIVLCVCCCVMYCVLSTCKQTIHPSQSQPIHSFTQGRTYMSVPAEFKKAPPDKNFIPKKHIHTWAGHTKGVTAIRFFPGSGHLLLSASMDQTCKIWSVEQSNRRCLRTYIGEFNQMKYFVIIKDIKTS